MKTSILASAALCVCLATAGGLLANPAQTSAEQILDAAAIQGGLIVQLGADDGSLAVALGQSPAFAVQVIDRDPAKVAAARKAIEKAGLYGRVSADVWAGPQLPFVDNVVNLLIVDDAKAASRDEMLRVLAPNGVLLEKASQGYKKTVKPRPNDIDQWTHYLHDASNNAVAHDQQIGPPRHLQWICGPNWSRHHDHMASLSALVSANGRIFYILDEGSRESVLLPSTWVLIARDAFSGKELWRRPIPEWNTQLWPLKSGPNQLPRRLVAEGDRVYVTLGIDAPVEVLDAASGKTLLTCAKTEHTDEILFDQGTLFLLVASTPNKWKDYRPQHTYVWSNTKRANADWAWDQEPRHIVAVDAQSGKTVWSQETKAAPLTLAADSSRVYLYDGEKAKALDRKTGQVVWASEPIVRKQAFPTGYGPTLVVYQDVVLLSIENPTMTAFSAVDGKKLWSSKHHHGGHASPDDMLIIDGLVWSGDVANGSNSGTFTGRDIHTGEVKKEFPPDVNPPWFHHRCYRSRATDRFFIASRTGLEYIDVEAKHWDINHWVRAGCLYGFMPANGLTYATPHACGCFLESKLFGFNALAPESASRRLPAKISDEGRIERGPAFGSANGGKVAAEAAWPTYRADAARSGSTPAAVPTTLKRQWAVDLGTKLSSVVVAQNKAFVAATDRHAVHAFDARSGKPAWSFTAGGRIDSPPSVFENLVLFGSADGFIYCLRADDGAMAWRFRAAPVDRRLMAYDQVESAWPVSGSVLIEDGSVFFVAGRSAFLDGGIRFFRLDPHTGAKLAETVIDDRSPNSDDNLQKEMLGQDMPVALPDVLSSDGRSIYMRAQAFDLQGVRRNIAPIRQVGAKRAKPDAAETADPAVANHVFSRTGFLDDSWFWRSYWIFGRQVDSNYGGWLVPGHFAPCGRLLVFDKERIFGFDRKPEYLCNASVAKYYLYGADREVAEESTDRVKSATGRINAASRDKSASSSDWATRKKFSLAEQNAATFHWAQGEAPIRARAMILAGSTLFAAGPPDLVNEEEAFKNPDDPKIRQQLHDQAESLLGKRGSQLLAISATDGQPAATYQLGSMPTFDGMAAAYGCLFLSTVDGKLICLGSQGEALQAAPTPALRPIDVKTKETDVPPVAQQGPSRKADFAKVTEAKVTESPMGYHVFSASKNLASALKKQSEPLTGRFELRTKMSVAADGQLRNGYLVFGDAEDPATLVHCGLRFAMKKAIIFQGAAPSDKLGETFDANDEKTYELRVAVDLDAKTVSYRVGDVTVSDTLKKAPKAVTHVGYAVINAAADFSPVEIVQGNATKPADKPAATGAGTEKTKPKAKPKAKRAQ